MAFTSPHPHTDFPFTMYFNGQPMPKWAQCWYASNILALAGPELTKWDDIGYFQNRAWQLQCRLDHTGSIESEDSLWFRSFALQFALTFVKHQSAICDSLRTFAQRYDVTAEDIADGIKASLWKMIELASDDRLAFWTVGYESDRIYLMEAMRRLRLSPEDPNYFPAPHLEYERSEAKIRWGILKKEAIARIHESGFSKDVRRQIHELAKE
jgi:hypothetical protein